MQVVFARHVYDSDECIVVAVAVSFVDAADATVWIWSTADENYQVCQYVDPKIMYRY